jgi:hypothetical protein
VNLPVPRKSKERVQYDTTKPTLFTHGGFV